MVKNKLTKEETIELLFKDKWCKIILDYIYSIEPVEGYNWQDDWDEIKMTKSDLKGLRMAYNDIFEMIQDLDPKQYKKLDEILRKKFGHGLFEADQKHIKRVTKIVEKGKISNKEQYYLLREYFERIWDMPEYKETAKKIEDILFTFEKIKI